MAVIFFYVHINNISLYEKSTVFLPLDSSIWQQWSRGFWISKNFKIWRHQNNEKRYLLSLEIHVWAMCTKLSYFSLYFFMHLIKRTLQIQYTLAQFSYYMISGRQEKIKSNHPNMIYFYCHWFEFIFQTLILGLDFTVW